MIPRDTPVGATIWSIWDDAVHWHVLTEDDLCPLESNTLTDPDNFTSELAAWEALAARRKAARNAAARSYLDALRRVHELRDGVGRVSASEDAPSQNPDSDGIPASFAGGA